MQTTDDKILLGLDELPLVSILKLLATANVVFGSGDEFKLAKKEPTI